MEKNPSQLSNSDGVKEKAVDDFSRLSTHDEINSLSELKQLLELKSKSEELLVDGFNKTELCEKEDRGKRSSKCNTILEKGKERQCEKLPSENSTESKEISTQRALNNAEPRLDNENDSNHSADFLTEKNAISNTTSSTSEGSNSAMDSDSNSSIRRLERKRKRILDELTIEEPKECGKRKKEDDLYEPPRLKGNEDIFCWQCHKDGNVLPCKTCPRAYHLKCARLEEKPSEPWTCLECEAVIKADNLEIRYSQLRSLSPTKLTVQLLGKLLRYVIERMKTHEGSSHFISPVDPVEYPQYRDFVVRPMDLSLLDENIKRKVYGSTESFLSDAKWLVHNSIIFNSVHSELTTIAKSIVKIAKKETEEIENCPDCYLHAHTLDELSWFVEPCKQPHLLVWAKLKGFPFWPCKVMKTVGNNVDVRFFSDHNRAWVPNDNCFLISKERPVSAKQIKLNNLDQGFKELEEHIMKLEQKFGKFCYFPSRTLYDPKKHTLLIKDMLPNFDKDIEPPEPVEPTEDVESERSSTPPDLIKKSVFPDQDLPKTYGEYLTLRKQRMTDETGWRRISLVTGVGIELIKDKKLRVTPAVRKLPKSAESISPSNSVETQKQETAFENKPVETAVDQVTIKTEPAETQNDEDIVENMPVETQKHEATVRNQQVETQKHEAAITKSKPVETQKHDAAPKTKSVMLYTGTMDNIYKNLLLQNQPKIILHKLKDTSICQPIKIGNNNSKVEENRSSDNKSKKQKTSELKNESIVENVDEPEKLDPISLNNKDMRHKSISKSNSTPREKSGTEEISNKLSLKTYSKSFNSIKVNNYNEEIPNKSKSKSSSVALKKEKNNYEMTPNRYSLKGNSISGALKKHSDEVIPNKSSSIMNSTSIASVLEKNNDEVITAKYSSKSSVSVLSAKEKKHNELMLNKSNSKNNMSVTSAKETNNDEVIPNKYSSKNCSISVILSKENKNDEGIRNKSSSTSNSKPRDSSREKSSNEEISKSNSTTIARKIETNYSAEIAKKSRSKSNSKSIILTKENAYNNETSNGSISKSNSPSITGIKNNNYNEETSNQFGATGNALLSKETNYYEEVSNKSISKSFAKSVTTMEGNNYDEEIPNKSNSNDKSIKEKSKEESIELEESCPAGDVSQVSNLEQECNSLQLNELSVESDDDRQSVESNDDAMVSENMEVSDSDSTSNSVSSESYDSEIERGVECITLGDDATDSRSDIEELDTATDSDEEVAPAGERIRSDNRKRQDSVSSVVSDLVLRVEKNVEKDKSVVNFGKEDSLLNSRKENRHKLINIPRKKNGSKKVDSSKIGKIRVKSAQSLMKDTCYKSTSNHVDEVIQSVSNGNITVTLPKRTLPSKPIPAVEGKFIRRTEQIKRTQSMLQQPLLFVEEPEKLDGMAFCTKLISKASESQKIIEEEIADILKTVSERKDKEDILCTLTEKLEFFKESRVREIEELNHLCCTKIVELKGYMEESSKESSERINETLINTNKRKHWCIVCLKEAKFYCCWLATYCSNKCQTLDWPKHLEDCSQFRMSVGDPYIRLSPSFQKLYQYHIEKATKKNLIRYSSTVEDIANEDMELIEQSENSSNGGEVSIVPNPLGTSPPNSLATSSSNPLPTSPPNLQLISPNKDSPVQQNHSNTLLLRQTTRPWPKGVFRLPTKPLRKISNLRQPAKVTKKPHNIFISPTKNTPAKTFLIPTSTMPTKVLTGNNSSNGPCQSNSTSGSLHLSNPMHPHPKNPPLVSGIQKKVNFEPILIKGLAKSGIIRIPCSQGGNSSQGNSVFMVQGISSSSSFSARPNTTTTSEFPRPRMMHIVNGGKARKSFSNSGRLLTTPTTITIPKNQKSLEPVILLNGMSPVVLKQGISNPLVLTQGIASPVVMKQGITSPVVMKQGVTSPVVLNQGVTSPVIQKQGVTSPVVLNQVVTSPVIQKQGVTSPVVLNEGVTTPVQNEGVTTPVVLNEGVTTPVQNEGITSPVAQKQVVTSPVVLNQDVTSPVIQKQGVISPVVINEGVTTPVVLNEGVTTPVVLNEGVTTPVVQNEGIISPVVQNQGVTSPVVLNHGVICPIVMKQGVTNTPVLFSVNKIIKPLDDRPEVVTIDK